MLPKRSLTEPVLVPRSSATKKMNSSKPGYEEKDEEEGRQRGEEYFDDKQVAVFFGGIEQKDPIDKTVLSEGIRDKTITVDYRKEKLKLHFMTLSAHLQACMILTDHQPSIFYYGRCDVSLQRRFYGSHSFQASLVPPRVLNFETSCNG